MKNIVDTGPLAYQFDRPDFLFYRRFRNKKIPAVFPD